MWNPQNQIPSSDHIWIFGRLARSCQANFGLLFWYMGCELFYLSVRDLPQSLWGMRLCALWKVAHCFLFRRTLNGVFSVFEMRCRSKHVLCFLAGSATKILVPYTRLASLPSDWEVVSFTLITTSQKYKSPHRSLQNIV